MIREIHIDKIAGLCKQGKTSLFYDGLVRMMASRTHTQAWPATSGKSHSQASHSGKSGEVRFECYRSFDRRLARK